MGVTLLGFVYYSDDPHARVFRRVFPLYSDSELDGPVTGPNGELLVDGGGNSGWTTFGLGGVRPVAMDKVSAVAVPVRFVGTVNTPATEPLLYYINLSLLVAGNVTQTTANLAALASFLGSTSSWSNQFNLTGTPATVVAGITPAVISPAWLVVIGGGNPGIGTLNNQTTIASQNVSLWVV